MTEQTINLNDNQSETIKPEDIYKCLDINDLPGEIWKDIPEYEGLYQVSNLGRVKIFEKEVVIHKNFKFSDEVVDKVIKLRDSGMKLREIKSETGISESHISKIYLDHKLNRSERSHTTLRKGKIMSGGTANGYRLVLLWRGGVRKAFKVHRLVAQVFISNTDNKPEVNHKDGNKFNNLADNLEWCTTSENVKHAFDTGLKRSLLGEDNPGSRFSNDEIIEMRKLRRNGISLGKIGKLYKTSSSVVYRIVSGQAWKHLS